MSHRQSFTRQARIARDGLFGFADLNEHIVSSATLRLGYVLARNRHPGWVFLETTDGVTFEPFEQLRRGDL